MLQSTDLISIRNINNKINYYFQNHIIMNLVARLKLKLNYNQLHFLMNYILLYEIIKMTLKAIYYY